MFVVAMVLAGLAAVIHLYIFYLESLAWTAPRTRAVFGLRSDEEVKATRTLAFNQGFYNLFLAIEIIAGMVLLALGHTVVGATLVFVGAGSMVAAGLVLLASSGKARAALIQLTAPLLGIIALAIAL